MVGGYPPPWHVRQSYGEGVEGTPNEGDRRVSLVHHINIIGPKRNCAYFWWPHITMLMRSWIKWIWKEDHLLDSVMRTRTSRCEWFDTIGGNYGTWVKNLYFSVKLSTEQFLNLFGVVDIQWISSFEWDWIHPIDSLTVISFHGYEKIVQRTSKQHQHHIKKIYFCDQPAH